MTSRNVASTPRKKPTDRASSRLLDLKARKGETPEGRTAYWIRSVDFGPGSREIFEVPIA